jgi:hypothetical protein
MPEVLKYFKEKEVVKERQEKRQFPILMAVLPSGQGWCARWGRR